MIGNPLEIRSLMSEMLDGAIKIYNIAYYWLAG